MSRWLPMMAGLICCHLTVAAGEKIPGCFQDGDTVCVIGDSITHGGLYQGYLQLFYATRFPEARIRMVNCGISGDTAEGVLRRFDWDIAPHRPTVATVMLGMNDVGHGLYGTEPADPASCAAQRQQLDTYAKNLAAIADRLKARNTRIIFFTASIYEQDATNLATPNRLGVNAGLANCAAEVKTLAARQGDRVVDVYALMNRINRERQLQDPAFTLVGPDRVHPGPAGHFVMAYAFLVAQDLPPPVAKMKLDARGTSPNQTENCEVRNFTANPDGLAFEYLARALPFPVDAEMRPALALIPFMAELNQELLVVTGLPAGNYELRIDGELITTSTAAGLATGINLAEFPATPQYRQALAVKQLNESLQWLQSGWLRNFALVRHWQMAKVDFDPEDFALAKPFLEAKLADPKTTEFERTHLGLYLKNKPQAAKVASDLITTANQMAEAAKPRPRQFTVTSKN